jgi:hypothetical protein
MKMIFFKTTKEKDILAASARIFSLLQDILKR